MAELSISINKSSQFRYSLRHQKLKQNLLFRFYPIQMLIPVTPLIRPRLVTNLTGFLSKGRLFTFLIKTFTSTLLPTLVVSGQAKINEVLGEGSVSVDALAKPNLLVKQSSCNKNTKNNKKQYHQSDEFFVHIRKA